MAAKMKANEMRRTKWLSEFVKELEANNGKFEDSVMLTKEELKRDWCRRVHSLKNSLQDQENRQAKTNEQ